MNGKIALNSEKTIQHWTVGEMSLSHRTEYFGHLVGSHRQLSTRQELIEVTRPSPIQIYVSHASHSSQGGVFTSQTTIPPLLP